jgi:hypothetical protein
MDNAPHPMLDKKTTSHDFLRASRRDWLATISRGLTGIAMTDLLIGLDRGRRDRARLPDGRARQDPLRHPIVIDGRR